MKFAILSDLHYISQQMIRDREYFERVNDIHYDDIQLKHALAHKTIEMLARSDVRDIFVIGDLTDEGDKPSTDEVVEMLRGLTEQGKRVYVLTATHDYHHHRKYCRKNPRNYIFKEEPWDSPYFEPEEFDYRSILRPEYAHLSDEDIRLQFQPAVYQSTLWQTYYEFGPAQAFSVCESAESYAVSLDDETWCLVLNDCFRNLEALKNDSTTFSPECLAWIQSVIDLAKEQGKYVFAVTHHPMVPPSPAYRIGADTRDMRHSLVGHYLADMGIQLIFTGHSHICDIGFLSSEKGNVMCDISTASPTFFPPQYRLVDLDGLKGRVRTQVVEIEMPEGMEKDGLSTRERMQRHLINRIRTELTDKNPRLGRLVAKLQTAPKVKTIYPLCSGACRLSRAEYNSVKDKIVFDLVVDVASAMIAGDGRFTPDTAEFKLMMGFGAVVDSILDAQPFYDVKGKILKGYGIRDILLPMLFNNQVGDGDADFDFTVIPQPRLDVPEYKSHAGGLLMTILCLCCILLSPLAVPAAIVGLPIACIAKRRKIKKDPPKPERY